MFLEKVAVGCSFRVRSDEQPQRQMSAVRTIFPVISQLRIVSQLVSKSLEQVASIRTKCFRKLISVGYRLQLVSNEKDVRCWIGNDAVLS